MMIPKIHIEKQVRHATLVIVFMAVALVRIPELVKVILPATPDFHAGYFLPDFFQDYASARNVLRGVDPYENHENTIRLYIKNGNIIEIESVLLKVNAHPPFSVILVLPFGFLEFPQAMLIFNLLSLIALVVSIWILVNQLRITPDASLIALLGIVLLCSGPLHEHLSTGQLSLGLLLLLTLAWASGRSGLPIVAGVLIGLAASVKLFPVFVLLPYVVHRQFKVLTSAVITILICVLLTASILGRDIFRYYFKDVMPQFEWFRAAWGNFSLLGVWSRLFDPASTTIRIWQNTDPVTYSPIACKVGFYGSSILLITWLLNILRKNKGQEMQDFEYGMTLIIMLLVTPITWEHSLFLVVPAFLFTWVALPSGLVFRFWFLFNVTCLFFAPPLFPLHTERLSKGFAQPIDVITHMSFKTIALISSAVLLRVVVSRNTVRHFPSSPFNSNVPGEAA